MELQVTSSKTKRKKLQNMSLHEVKQFNIYLTEHFEVLFWDAQPLPGLRWEVRDLLKIKSRVPTVP